MLAVKLIFVSNNRFQYYMFLLGFSNKKAFISQLWLLKILTKMSTNGAYIVSTVIIVWNIVISFIQVNILKNGIIIPC